MASRPQKAQFTPLFVNGLILSKYLTSAIVLSFIGFLFYLLGFALPSWNDFSADDTNAYTYKLVRIGLWVTCYSQDGAVVCSPYSGTKGVTAVRTFAIFTLFFYIAYIILFFLHLRFHKLKTLIWGAFMTFCIGLLTAIFCLVWITQLSTTLQYNLSSGFSLTFLSYFCMHVTCIVLCFEIKTLLRQEPNVEEEEDQKVTELEQP